jgi:uncharacterized protein DUF2561
MVDVDSDAWRGRGTMTPATGDRILVGLCAAVWLALVGTSVAAAVALMDLGRGFHEGAENPHTSSVLYGIIIVSALIILAAIPMLLRARRTTRDGPVARSGGMSTRSAGRQPLRSAYHPARAVPRQGRTDRTTMLQSALPDAAVDRIWLRGTVALMCAMGLALVAVAAATYLMAIGHDTVSWTGYAIAGFVTLTMPLVPWRHLRQLRRMLAAL